VTRRSQDNVKGYIKALGPEYELTPQVLNPLIFNLLTSITLPHHYSLMSNTASKTLSQAAPAPYSSRVVEANPNHLLSSSLSALQPITGAVRGLLDSKDRRAFEHDRQRSHKPSDRKVKAPRRTLPFVTVLSSSSAAVRRPVKDENRRYGFVNLGEVDEYRSDMDEVEAEDTVATERTNLQVSLVDLVRPERKRTGIAQGFEIVPRVRTVMIMEDSEVESVKDEYEGEILDWEVVPESRQKVRARQAAEKKLQKASYASIVRAPGVMIAV